MFRLLGFRQAQVPRCTRKFFRWITNTAAGSTKWSISNPTGTSTGSRLGWRCRASTSKQYDPAAYDETHQTTGGGEACKHRASPTNACRLPNNKGAKTYQGGSRILYRPSGGSAIPLATQEVLVLAEDAERLAVKNMTEQRTTRRLRQQEEEEELFAELRASSELDKRRRTPKQKGTNSTTVLEEDNFSMKTQIRKLTEQVQLLTKSLQERGQRARQRALLHARNSREEHNDEYNEFRGDDLDGRTGAMQHSWSCVGFLDQHNRDWCSPGKEHPQEQQCGGTRREGHCHTARRQRTPPGGPGSQTPSRKILGASESTTSLVQPEMRILPHNIPDFGQPSDGSPETGGTREDVYNRDTKELLNGHTCKLDSEETFAGNGPINVQLGILISNKKECKDWAWKPRQHLDVLLE